MVMVILPLIPSLAPLEIVPAPYLKKFSKILFRSMGKVGKYFEKILRLTSASLFSVLLRFSSFPISSSNVLVCHGYSTPKWSKFFCY